MATHNYSTEIILRNIPNWVDGDRVDLSGVGKLIIDQSVSNIGQVDFNGVFQAVELVWSSTTQPMIVNATAQWVGSSGTILFNGGLVSLTSADGTANQVVQVPPDSLGRYPKKINHIWVGGNSRWTQISTLADLYGDGMTRGKHFTYNNLNGEITFGDGVNGARPSGTLQIENIYFEHNNNTLFASGMKIQGSGGVVIIESAISSNFQVDLDENASWGIADYNGNLTPEALFKHKYRNFSFINSNPAINTRTLLGESHEDDHIILQTESTASTEVFQNVRVAMNGLIESRCINQKINSAWPRLRMYNDGGDVTFHIMQGEGAIFTPYGGVNGTWRFYYTEGYKRTDNKPYRVVHGRYDGRYIVPHFGVLEGETTTYATEEEWILDLDDGYWEIGAYSDNPSDDFSIVIPDNVRVDEVLNFSGYSRGKLNRLKFLGEASSGSRDGNTWTPRGWIISNIEMPNDSSHGFQPEDNQELHFVSHVGQEPQFGRNMSHSTIIKNSARTQGQVWLMPHPDGENAGMIAGDESDLIYTTYQVYYEPNANTYTRTGVLQGWQTINGLYRVGSSLDNFTFSYKFWDATDSEPASYTTVTWNGNAADSSSLAALQALTTGHTTQTRKYFKYSILKNGQPVNVGEIRGFYLDVTLDPSFIWMPDGAEITVSLPNILQGSQYIFRNVTKSLTNVRNGFAGASGISEVLTEGIDFDIGDSFKIDIAKHDGLRIWEKETAEVVLGDDNVTLPNSQQEILYATADNDFIDGSTVTWLTLDVTNPSILQFDADSSNIPNVVNSYGVYAQAKKWDMVCWYFYAIGKIPLAIEMFFDEMTLEDAANCRMNNGVLLDNIAGNGNGMQINFSDTHKRIYKESGEPWTLSPTTSGYGFTYDSERIPNVPPPLSASEKTHLLAIPTDTADQASVDAVKSVADNINANALRTDDERIANLDATVSSRATQQSVNDLPTNALATDDPRLDNLDVAVSTRASQQSVDGVVDILEADEEVRPNQYRKLHKTTKAPLVTKNVTKSGDDIDLVEP